jgi:hypothetical protein
MRKIFVLSRFTLLVALAAIVGFTFIGCGNSTGPGNSGDPILSGTIWKYFGSAKDKQLRFSQNGNEVYFNEIRGGSYSLNGTYTLSGKNVTFTFIPFTANGVISEDGKSMTVKNPVNATEVFVKQ